MSTLRPILRALIAALLLSSSTPGRADARADATSLIRRGVELRKEHRNDEALAAFAQAFALAPSPAAQAQRALAEQALGRWLDAEKDLEAALASEDDRWIEKNRGADVGDDFDAFLRRGVRTRCRRWHVVDALATHGDRLA
jgi:tetratricopeptide (TPR) repeat protein